MASSGARQVLKLPLLCRSATRWDSDLQALPSFAEVPGDRRCPGMPLGGHPPAGCESDSANTKQSWSGGNGRRRNPPSLTAARPGLLRLVDWPSSSHCLPSQVEVRRSPVTGIAMNTPCDQTAGSQSSCSTRLSSSSSMNGRMATRPTWRQHRLCQRCAARKHLFSALHTLEL